MKRILRIAMGATVFSVLVVNIALAFSLSNIDGVWEYVEDITETSTTPRSGEGADCSRWASGNGDGASLTSTWNTAIQSSSSTTDENQVRYGLDSNGNCRSFGTQSGMGFDGREGVGTLSEDTPFWVGRFTHYNNPINLSNPPNFMEWVDLDLSVMGISCGNGQPPNEGSNLNFIYRFNFEETPNSQNPCPYGGDANGCYDLVTVDSTTTSTTYTCDDPDDPNPGTFTLTILGFQPHSSTNCSTQTYNQNLVSNTIISLEQADNHTCLWAQITRYHPTAVDLSMFTATVEDTTVLLSWETATEIDNLGFDIYRSTRIDGDRAKINSDLIPSIAPGSLFGAIYEYRDTSVVPDGTYYYWLEAQDRDGKLNLYGPAMVEMGPELGLNASWRLFLPSIQMNPSNLPLSQISKANW